MQRKRLVICLIMCCLLATTFLQAPMQAADAGGQGTLLILLDVSGSMKTSDEKYVARNWAQGLCAMCSSVGVDTEVILFGDQSDVQEKNDKNVPKLNNVKYGGETTNHLEAIKTAESLISPSTAELCGIVILSDGVLDLIGRKPEDITTPREDNEIDAIDGFLEKCGDLGAAGNKMLFIGFGDEQEPSEDPYGLDGFGMFREADKKINCTFIKADNFPDTNITHFILNMLGFDYQENFEGTMEGNVISFELDKEYLKYGICINKTLDKEDSVKAEDIQVTKDGVSRGSAADFGIHATDYGYTIFLCLDQPEPGKYELELPELVGNKYTVCFQGYVNQVSLEISLKDGEEQTVQKTGQNGNIIEYTVGSTDCMINLKLNGDSVSIENVTDYQYQIFEIDTEKKMEIACAPIHILPSNNDELSDFFEEIRFPLEEGKDKFSVQASLKVNEELVESNLLNVKVEVKPEPYQEVFLKVNEPGDIPQSEEEKRLTDREKICYIVKKKQEDGSYITCDGDIYNIDDDGKTANITFKQPGRYCVQTKYYDIEIGNPQGYDVTDKPYTITKNMIVGGAGVVVLAVVFLASTAAFRRNKRKQK